MFFGYFLNIKKVTPSADFVIGPAKAEVFLFSHTRLPFPPRPLLPFGRISPAAKPRVRLPAPPFGFAAQNRARHFATRNHPVRLSASRPWLRHPAPLFCRSRHGRAAPGPQRQNPGPCSRSVAFRLRRNRAAGHRPHRGRCFAVPVAAAPRRGPNGKTPALFGYFLNIKKVTPSADFVISPAKAGVFLFPTRGFRSRRPFLRHRRAHPREEPRAALHGHSRAGQTARHATAHKLHAGQRLLR